MKTLFQSKQKLLVLVSHRDIRSILRKYSESLFRAGYSGAYFFPWAAPLAALSRFLSEDELKRCARAIREASAARGCKISAVENDAIELDSRLSLFGPRLDITFPQDAFGEASKIIRVFTPPVIGACLFTSSDAAAPVLPPPALSFRAAAVANMIWLAKGSPDPGSGKFYCKWKIGKLCWLPHTKGKKTTNERE